MLKTICLHDTEYRSKDLLLVDVHVRSHSSHHGRSEEVTVLKAFWLDAPSVECNRGALFHGALNKSLGTLESGWCDHRTNIDGRIKATSDLECGGGSYEVWDPCVGLQGGMILRYH